MHQAFRVRNAPSHTLSYKNPSSNPVGEESHQLRVQMRFRAIYTATQLVSGAVTANGVSAPLVAPPAELSSCCLQVGHTRVQQRPSLHLPLLSSPMVGCDIVTCPAHRVGLLMHITCIHGSVYLPFFMP